MTTPRRIQRRRTKGWRLPPDAVYVGRPSLWGNPFRVGHRYLEQRTFRTPWWTSSSDPITPEQARSLFRAYVVDPPAGATVDELRDWLNPLRGHDLACWCPLCDAHADGRPAEVACPDCPPCHADILLTLANR